MAYSPFRTGDSMVDRNLDAIAKALNSPGSSGFTGARYTADSTTGVPTAPTIFTYTNQTYDTDDAYVSGGYNAPSPGLYEIQASIAINGAVIQDSTLAIYKNGLLMSYGYAVRPAAINYNLVTSVSDTLQLAQGDVVTFQHSCSVNTSTTYVGGTGLQFFSIIKIGT